MTSQPNEDADTTADRLGKFAGAQQALMRQATISDDDRAALAESFDDKSVRRGFMKKVYGILSVQLIFTVGVMAIFIFYIGGNYPEHGRRWVSDNLWLLWTSMGVSLVVLIPMVCIRTLRVSFPINFILLSIFTICESIMMGMVSMMYTTESVIIAAGITSCIVFFLTIFAFQTKIDFTACRGIMGCILFVFIIFGIIMIFVPPSRYLDIVYGCIGALIFSVYLVIDTQMMMGGNHRYSISPEEYIFAAVALYLDILNIFLYLLKIFGKK
eukprot:GFUD01034996.1.p1 GENE.GFUD01034996.1~~GFUD01034996.1.p1  ORF type:complete len:270 (-),score=53.49 GFUD01034996.1:248-1057(-)